MAARSASSRAGLVAGGTGALLLGLGLWCARTPPVVVETAVAHRAPLEVDVHSNGTVEPVPEAELRVHARLRGRIVHLPEPGTRIAAGDLVLEIDSAPVAAEIARSESERLAAQESLRAARQTHELMSRRAETDAELFAQGALTSQRNAVTRAELAEARERLANLEREVPLRVAALDLRIGELREQLDGARVEAPFDGTLYRREFKEGEIVRVGDPVLWFADLSRLRVRANIDQVDLGRVREGQRMRVASNAYPGRTWSAVVSELVPHVIVKDNRSVSEGLALVDPPSDGLLPGMIVDVEIVVAEVPEALQVPATALHGKDDGAWVFVVAGGRAQRTPVVAGRASVTDVEILEGLEEDSVVIVGRSNGLTEGSRVEPQLPDVAAR